MSFDGPGGARRSDPSTSKRAAAEVAPSAKNQRGQALNTIIAAAGGLTAAEVVEQTGVEGIWKRVSELEQGAYIRVQGERHNAKTGKMNQVYVATEKGRVAMGNLASPPPDPLPSGTDGVFAALAKPRRAVSAYDPTSEWA